MDKKHVSCMNMHSKRTVKLLIEKFECMGECKAQIAGKQKDWNIQAVAGRVAATVAKFEHSSFLSQRLMEARLQHTCGDQATELWLAELKRKMLEEVMKSSQAKLALADNAIQSERDNESVLADLRHQDILLDPSMMPPVPPPSAADELSGDKSKHLLTAQGSNTSVYNTNNDLPPVPSFNGFDFSTSQVLICSLSRQVMRSVYTCGQAIAAIGKWFAHAWCRILPINRRVDVCSTSMQVLYQNSQHRT
ncbi:PREDICTED: uncharacterized protein LOC108619377 isoform X1 [Drosophila arizonae]|uniref:Uncharacterized protein LOC108619377 isoform X1 n=1 Tax=Drosophila arizonae TaxID=7263 RepID=A0ABM1PW39_DROAR|nr:PREDICTED: uncharacterized protein LOC108619377 isoform X1 [Drosophila arizonae]